MTGTKKIHHGQSSKSKKFINFREMSENNYQNRCASKKNDVLGTIWILTTVVKDTIVVCEDLMIKTN